MLKLLRNLSLLIVLASVVSGYSYRRRQRQRQRQPRVEYCPEEHYYNDYNRDADFDQKTDDIVYNWDENDDYADGTGLALRAVYERTVEEPPNDEPSSDEGDADDQGQDGDGDAPLPPIENPSRTLVPTIETTTVPTTTETPKYIPKYVITCANVIQSQKSFDFYLTLFEDSQEFSLPVKFTATMKIDEEIGVEQTFTQTNFGLQKHTFKQLQRFPSQAGLRIEIEFDTEGVAEENTTMNSYLQQKQDRYVFIQTDKAVYKPGHDVRIVVMVLNADLTPYGNQNISITIQDPKRNIIQSWKEIKLLKYGVAEVGFTLSTFTELGAWLIEVDSSDDSIPDAQKNFDVQYYVLPEVEVEMNVNGELGYFVYDESEQSYEAQVKAAFSHGKDAYGMAMVTLDSTGYCNWEYDNVESTRDRLVWAIEYRGADSEFDGKFVANGLNKLLFEVNENLRECRLTFKIEFIEQNTGRSYLTSTNARFFRYPYSLKAHESNERFVRPGISYTGRFEVTKADGSALTASDGPVDVTYDIYMWTPSNPNDWRVSCYATPNENDTQPLPTPNQSGHATVDSNGAFIIEIDQIPDDIESVMFKIQLASEPSVQLCDTRSKISSVSGHSLFVELDRPVPGPLVKVGESLTVKIKATYAAEWVYVIISENGRAVVYKKLENPQFVDNLAVFSYTFKVPHGIAPRANVVAWTVEMKWGEILSDQRAFDIDGFVRQEVEAGFTPEKVKPGEQTSLSIATSEGNSLVMLLAIDRRVRLLKSGNQITKEQVLNLISGGGAIPFFSYGFLPCWGGLRCWPYPGGGDDPYNVFQNAQMSIFSNMKTRDIIYRPFYREMAANDAPTTTTQTVIPSSPEVTIRKDFPEVWIWRIAYTDGNGKIQMAMTAPEAITTYELSAFSIGLKSGFGAFDEPVELLVTKDFFVNLDVKTAKIKRHEQVQLPILVSNYQQRQVQAVVVLQESADFQVYINGSYKNADFIQDVTIKANTVLAVPVWIRAQKLGSVSFIVKAHPLNSNESFGDGVEVKIQVEAEGRVFYKNRAHLFQLPEEDSATHRIDVVKMFEDVEGSVVEGSKQFQIQAIGSPLGAALTNLDRFITLPYGCGEQNLVTTAPNIYIYRYLVSSGLLTSELEVKIKTNAQKGHDHQLTFQRSDGGFSAFGESDPASSTWLTAFSAQIFSNAKKYLEINVNNEALNKAFDFIGKQLAPDGSYNEPGRVIHTAMIGGLTGRMNLAAYIYLTMRESDRPVPAATRELLISTLQSTTDQYQLALIAYAFSFDEADQSYFEMALEKLLAKGNQVGELLYWGPAVASEYKQLGQSSIETTSYAILSLLVHGDLSKAIQAGRWLMTQRNSLGGFVSTQDTVVGLKALSALSQHLTANGQHLQISTYSNYDEPTMNLITHDFTITRENSVVLQSFDLPIEKQLLHSVDIDAMGVGTALVQLAAKYNLKNYDTGCFNVDVTISGDIESDENVGIQTCISTTNGNVEAMTLVEIDVPTGFVGNLPATTDLNALADGDLIFPPPLNKIELGDGKIVFYFYELTQKQVCVSAVISRNFPTMEVDPAQVTVYSYYALDKCYTSQPAW